LLAYLGQISYSVFLVNFPVALVINALFANFAPDNILANGLGMLVAWLSCVLVGAIFHRYIESRTRTVQIALGRIGSLLLYALRNLLHTRPLQRIFDWLALFLRARL
jgi:peptidoglycan/LPS O-acetylase OafA/YrhL